MQRVALAKAIILDLTGTRRSWHTLLRQGGAALLFGFVFGSVSDAAAERVRPQLQEALRHKLVINTEFTHSPCAFPVASKQLEDQPGVVRLSVEWEAIGNAKQQDWNQAFVAALLPCRINLGLLDSNGYSAYQIATLEDWVAGQPTGSRHQLAGTSLLAAEFYQFGCGVGLRDFNGEIVGCPGYLSVLESKKPDVYVNISSRGIPAVSQDVPERDFRSLIIKNEIASNTNLGIYPWPLGRDERFAGYACGIPCGIGRPLSGFGGLSSHLDIAFTRDEERNSSEHQRGGEKSQPSSVFGYSFLSGIRMRWRNASPNRIFVSTLMIGIGCLSMWLGMMIFGGK
jgi:hypothetical protein